ncbi:MAG: TIR domain-containing protein [Anaerolineae bacterium]|nr:TIR domain-containing protein [Anaerolineae bacterium]
MRRVYISYASSDRDHVLTLTTQLRAAGVDVFYDPERTIVSGEFTRRLSKEIMTRGCLLLLQSAEALKSPLVQTELDFAYQQHIEIIPLILQPLNIRETGEFRFLLNLHSIGWQQPDTTALRQLMKLLQKPDNQTVIRIRTAATLKLTATLHEHKGWVREVAFSPDGYLMASTASDNSVCIWDFHTANRMDSPPELYTRITEHEKMVWGVAFSPAHPYLATGSGDSTVRLWDLNMLPTTYEYTRFTNHQHPVYSLAYSQDGRLLASASHDNTVFLRDVGRVDVTGRESASVRLMHPAHVYRVNFSPDNRLLVTTSRDSAVRLWSLEGDDLNQLARSRPCLLTGHSSWVNDAVFSPNGLLLASAGHDSTIRLWDVNTAEEIAVLTGHQDAVNSLAFSADGSLLVSAAKDYTLRLWDVEKLRELRVIRGHEHSINTVCLSPDGTKLVTGSGDSTLKLWSIGE